MLRIVILHLAQRLVSIVEPIHHELALANLAPSQAPEHHADGAELAHALEALSICTALFSSAFFINKGYGLPRQLFILTHIRKHEAISISSWGRCSHSFHVLIKNRDLLWCYIRCVRSVFFFNLLNLAESSKKAH